MVISTPERFQIFHDLVTQGVMAAFSHSDLVLLRKVLYADCYVSQILISFAHRQAERLMPCTCSAALARRFLLLVNLSILAISDSPLPKISVLLVNSKDKAIGQTSILWICRVFIEVPGPFLNFILRQLSAAKSSLVVGRSTRGQKLLAGVYVGGRPP